jgi:transposase-like protein
MYSPEMACGVTQPRCLSCKPKERRRGTAASELGAIAITESNPTTCVKRRLRAMQGPRTTATAWAVIQGIEAAYMIRKGQALGITRNNLHGQAWLFGSLLGVA